MLTEVHCAILYIDVICEYVFFGMQKTERVALWESSDLDDVSIAFAEKFGLKPDSRLKLRALLARERDEVLRGVRK